MNELSVIGEWLQSGRVLAVIVPVAAVAGRLLSRAVGSLSEPRSAEGSRLPLVELTAAAAAVAIWWWEVRGLGQLPAGSGPPEWSVVGLRYLSHLILFTLLAAASWVDLRDRVIPDSITVPGVLGGLAWNATFPLTLLPVGHAVARSFAPPALLPDVLGGFGPLQHVGLPLWLTGATGLGLALAVFAAWWWFGLPPAAPPTPGLQHPDARLGQLRLPIAAVGVIGIVGTWLVGGDHWTGLFSAMLGLAVAGGMIWATRAGASRALGREAMGFGDVTLMAMAGAWLGWQACVLACVIGVFIGLAHGVLQLVRHAESELPFGPSLCLGLAVVVLGWRPLWAAAAPQFERPLEMAIVVTLVILMTAATLWAWARLRGRSL
jgi:leader peptidase (prepilin peptidase) / N-methyltransferase